MVGIGRHEVTERQTVNCHSLEFLILNEFGLILNVLAVNNDVGGFLVVMALHQLKGKIAFTAGRLFRKEMHHCSKTAPAAPMLIRRSLSYNCFNW